MSEALAVEAPGYIPPKNGMEINERDILGTNLGVILYVGEIATLDIVEFDEEHHPRYLIESLHAPLDEATVMYDHPASYLSASRARELFDPGSSSSVFDQAA